MTYYNASGYSPATLPRSYYTQRSQYLTQTGQNLSYNAWTAYGRPTGTSYTPSSVYTGNVYGNSGLYPGNYRTPSYTAPKPVTPVTPAYTAPVPSVDPLTGVGYNIINGKFMVAENLRGTGNLWKGDRIDGNGGQDSLFGDSGADVFDLRDYTGGDYSGFDAAGAPRVMKNHASVTYFQADDKIILNKNQTYRTEIASGSVKIFGTEGYAVATLVGFGDHMTNFSLTSPQVILA
jgi:hypothetical protein